IEAAADIGGMAAALNLLLPVPVPWIVVGITITVLALQFFGSYEFIRSVFRWLALTLLAYVASALLAGPNWGEALRGTLVPTLKFDVETLSLLVAVIGTTLSAYLYTWQSNQEVEEKRAEGKETVLQRKGTT